jgi:aldehyde:ferredoxin oxidoreductase
MMAGGYMGKLLFVNLSTGEMKEEPLDENILRNFIGGSGIGARMLYSLQKGGVDPLGPENMLGILTGPFTGTIVPPGLRYMAVAKSPLTGGWGEANSGGFFGPNLKFAGWDGVYFTGISPKPVFLLLDSGKAELKDATYLWGKDSYETEDVLTAEYKDSRVICIGPAGEKLSLVSCIMTNHGSAAGRSGLGAVMGSKKLKAIVARGTKEVVIADKIAAQKYIMAHIKTLTIVGSLGISPMEKHHKYGTSYTNYTAAHSGDAPVKNWGGVGVVDFPNRDGLHPDVFAGLVEKGHGCWHCPIRCKALLKASTEGEYQYPAGIHRPEYETATSFGTLCLNGNTGSIVMVNDICNRAGLDTISSGSIIAFAIELYENGILTQQDTDGIDLRWGNHQAIVAMTRKLANREGIGNVLANGVKRASEIIGKGAEQFAMHIGGQEVAMHDPKVMSHGIQYSPAARYKMDATPGRHTTLFGPLSFVNTHFLNVTGLCHFGRWPESEELMVGIFKAVTGWDYSWDDMLKTGERIVDMRHAFNLREGICELNWKVPPRIIGNPPQQVGPLAGVTADIDAQIYWGMGYLDWDRFTTKPSKAKLLSLGGMDDVAKELWH